MAMISRSSIEKIAANLLCPVCTQLFSNPYSISECGHTFCQPCLMDKMSECRRCPVCNVGILIKNLRRNPSLGTMALCIGKMQLLLKDANYGDYASIEAKTKRSTPKRSMATVVQLSKTPASELAALALATPTIANTPTLVSVGITSPRAIREACSDADATPSKKSKSSKEPCKSKSKARSLVTNGSNIKRLSQVTRPAYVFLTTGLDEDQKMIFSSSFSKIGNQKAFMRTKYSPDVTHIITACNEQRLCPRTAKYMRGVLESCHIVSYDWFLASLSANGFVEEQSFWIRGDDVVGMVTEPVQKSIQRADRHQKLFTGLSVMLAGSFTAPTRADISSLITAGDGKVLTRRPLVDDASNVWIIYDPSSLAEGTINWIHAYDKIASWGQLFDCISYYSIKPLENQLKRG